MKKSLFAALVATVAVSASAETIYIAGSDTLGAKMVPQLCEAYKAKNPDVSFSVRAEGSSTAFKALSAGTAQIGMSSRKIKSKEYDRVPTAREYIAAIDMIAVIVNANNTVGDLTLDQVEGIFTGEITDWSEVGGNPGPINAYTRNTSSGTYATFQKLAMGGNDYGANTQKMAGNEQIAQEVGKDPNGIGYVGIAYTGASGVKPASVNGVAPTPANKKGYALSRDLNYYTVGRAKGTVKDFLDWATTDPEAHAIIEKVGFIAP